MPKTKTNNKQDKSDVEADKRYLEGFAEGLKHYYKYQQNKANKPLETAISDDDDMPDLMSGSTNGTEIKAKRKGCPSCPCSSRQSSSSPSLVKCCSRGHGHSSRGHNVKKTSSTSVHHHHHNHGNKHNHSHSSGGNPCLLHSSGSSSDHFHDAFACKHNHHNHNHSRSLSSQPQPKKQNNESSHRQEEEDDDDDEYEDCDDDYEEEEDMDSDEESCEDEDGSESDSEDDDRSSASGYTNSRDEGRVCDCCYCEVFGHGMPYAMSHTSRNYSEMRERLRQRLSKRKAEKCPESNGNGNGNGPCIDSSKLLNFGHVLPRKGIEGKGGPSKGRSVSPVPQQDNRDLQELVNFIEGSSTKNKGKSKSKAKSNNKKVKENGIKKEVEEVKNGFKENGTSKGVKGKSSSCSPSRSNPCPNPSTKGIDKITNGHVDGDVNGDGSPRRAQSSNGASNGVSNGVVSLNPPKKEIVSKKKNGKTKQNGKDPHSFVCPEEVFKPKDVNLESVQMDPLEKELEAFKRFCFDSKPAPPKEKISVKVNLKDIFGKKAASNNPAKSLNGNS